MRIGIDRIGISRRRELQRVGRCPNEECGGCRGVFFRERLICPRCGTLLGLLA